MQFDQEFKDAIIALSEKEKDKLIIRLLRKDKNLAKKLYFELVDTATVEDKRQLMEMKVVKKISAMFERRSYRFDSLLKDMRSINAEIAEHVRITNDKYGEVSLNLLFLIEILKKTDLLFTTDFSVKRYKASIYIIAKLFRTLILMQKLDSDFHIDFRSMMEELGEKINAITSLQAIARDNNFETDWLIDCDIPEELPIIYRKTREQGLLR